MRHTSRKMPAGLARPAAVLILLGGIFPGLTAQELIQETASFTVPAENGDPVVILAGDETVTRSRFEQDFQLAMVMLAAESSIPIKNQAQIDLLRRRYLDRRARNLALLAVAEREGITAPVRELNRTMKDYLDMLGITGPPGEELARLGFSDPGQLRDKLQERLIIEAVLRKLDETRRIESPQITLDAYVAGYLGQDGVETYPDRLAR